MTDRTFAEVNFDGFYVWLVNACFSAWLYSVISGEIYFMMKCFCGCDVTVVLIFIFTISRCISGYQCLI